MNGDGIFYAGDTVTVSWDNSITGDNNADVTDTSQVEFNIFDIVPNYQAGNVTAGVFSATYIFSLGGINATDLYTSVTVTDDAGNVKGPILDMEAFDVNTQAVPLPGAVWLLGSGLIAMTGLKRRFKI